MTRSLLQVLAPLCVCIVLWAAAPASGQAQSASPPADRAAAPRAERDRLEAEQTLSEARGALARQEWAQAELLLERALMLQPESAEAMIELARLLALRGRVPEALALLHTLAEDPRTPEPQAQSLRALLGRLDRKPDEAVVPLVTGHEHRHHRPPAESAAFMLAAPSPWVWRMEALAGYSTNPLVVTSASTLTLTLPDGLFQLPLEGRPQGAAYAGMTWALRTGSGVEGVVQAQRIDLRGQAMAHRAALLIPLTTHPARGEGAGLFAMKWSALIRTQRFGDGSQRHQLDLHVAPREPWTLQLGWFQEPDRQREGPFGRFEWTMPFRDQSQAAVWAEAEVNRAAGAPGHAAAGARLTVQLHPAWSLHMQGQAQRDTAGYSQLLENNARRTLRTQHVSLEHLLGGFPLSPWRIRLYDARRISNLALFSWRDTGVQLIWRKSW